MCVLSKRSTTAFVLWTLLALTASAGDFQLANIFSDHMVLQREKSVSVWGWADPGQKVTVAFGGQTKETTVDANGKWVIKLDPLAASDVPQELTVRLGDRQVSRLTDILVGEVWLGSGQSNMAMTVDRCQNADHEKKTADWPKIRMFREDTAAMQQPAKNSQGSWKVCTPDNVGAFSATLFFFGRALHQDLNVPIGLVNSSVGGTPIESWLSLEAQSRVPELKGDLEKALLAHKNFDETKARNDHQAAMTKWKQRADKAKADGKPVPRAPRDPVTTFKRRGGPGDLFNGKIAPLIPFAIRGIIWYQGESAGNSTKSHLYKVQLPELVTDWRSRWNEELPFAWVQLPNYTANDAAWPEVREAMLETLRLPKTGMAITIDIGDPKDIHPKNKQDVGQRLAWWALGEVYHRVVPAISGPIPVKNEIIGRDVVVEFKHCQGGLKSRDGQSLKGFMIAGADKQWQIASARIEGDRIRVSHPDIAKPAFVRYAWSANPDCNLINGVGLPATPFRTDH